MELRVLQYFLAVAREQNISAAAQSLHLTQPTLSRQLKELEEELGKQLMIRGNRAITLTEEGMLLRRRAEEILELVERTEQEVMQSDDSVSGNIYIGTGETDTHSRTGHQSHFFFHCFCRCHNYLILSVMNSNYDAKVSERLYNGFVVWFKVLCWEVHK